MNPRETQPDLDGGHRGVESPAGNIMSYTQKEYNFFYTHIKNMSNLVGLRLSTSSNDRYFSWTIPSMVLHCLHETKYPVTSLGSFNSSVSYPVAVISAPHFVQLAIIISINPNTYNINLFYQKSYTCRNCSTINRITIEGGELKKTKPKISLIIYCKSF